MRKTVLNTMTSLEGQINKRKEKLSLLSLNILKSLQTKSGANNNININNNSRINNKNIDDNNKNKKKRTTTEEITKLPNTNDT